MRLVHVLIHLLVLAVAVHLTTTMLGGSFHDTLFTDRDLVRAAHLADVWPTSGAELSGGVGARVPGPGLGLLMALPRLFTDDPYATFSLQTVMLGLGLVVLHVGLARSVGPTAGLVAAVLWASSPPVHATVLRLWNPGFVPLFEAVALAAFLDVLARQDARALPLFAAAVAFGTQLHLSLLSLALALLPGLWIARPSGLRVALVRSLTVVTLLYLPYLVDEALHGLPNTRALLAQDGLRTVTYAWSRPAEAVGVALDLKRLRTDLPGPLALLPLLLAGLGAPALDAAGRRVVATFLVATVLTAIALGSPLAPALEDRYVATLVPAVVVAVGTSAAALLRSRSVGLRIATASGLGVGLTSTAPQIGAAHAEGQWDTWDTVTGAVAALEARQGWDLSAVVGRTVWRRVDPEMRSTDLVDWPPSGILLDRAGLAWPGSLSPPCALVVSTDPDPRLADPAIVADLVRALGTVRVLDGPFSLRPGVSAVIWSPEVGLRCPTTMAQRYVDTPEEASLRAAVDGLGCDTVVELPGARGRRFGVVLDAERPGGVLCNPFALSIALLPTSDGVDVRLDSNQLRGISDNLGWILPAAVRRPTQIFSGPGGAVEVALAEGVVGWHAELAPIEAHAVIPAGTWTVDLVLDVLDLGASNPGLATDRRTGWRADTLVATQVRERLADNFVR